MNQTEKIATLKIMLLPDSPMDDELIALLNVTKGAILNRRYPQGYDITQEVPCKYEHIQLQACVQLYNKKGAEGQSSHNENGIARVYEQGDIPISLLKQVLPMAGSVMLNEES